MTKLIVLIVALLSVSLYATSTKRVCGKDGNNYDSYASIAYGDRAHVGYCGTKTQIKGAPCVKNVPNDCRDGLVCSSLNVHPCENVQCADGEVCLEGTCRDASLRCSYCKTGQVCIGGECRTDCNLICNGGTCRNNECYSNVGTCTEEEQVPTGTGNKKKGGCSMGGSSSTSFFAFFIFLVAIVSFRRRRN